MSNLFTSEYNEINNILPKKFKCKESKMSNKFIFSKLNFKARKAQIFFYSLQVDF